MIKFNQKGWLKSYNDMNTNLRRKVKNNFVKDLLMLMNHVVFGRTSMENVWKHKNIKIVTTERRII